MRYMNRSNVKRKGILAAFLVAAMSGKPRVSVRPGVRTEYMRSVIWTR